MKYSAIYKADEPHGTPTHFLESIIPISWTTKLSDALVYNPGKIMDIDMEILRKRLPDTNIHCEYLENLTVQSFTLTPEVATLVAKSIISIEDFFDHCRTELMDQEEVNHAGFMAERIQTWEGFYK